MGEHPACITAAAGGGEAVPMVVRVYTIDTPDPSPILIEAPLGLSWTQDDRLRAWGELVRRADIALAEHGYQRVADWSHHVYPLPLARARVSRAT